MDHVRLAGIRRKAKHGVLDREKRQAQWFRIDVTLGGDFEAALQSDKLADALNYARVHDVIVAGMQERRFDLIEALAGHLCRRVLEEVPATVVQITLVKENPPIPGFPGEASVTLQRDRAWLEKQHG